MELNAMLINRIFIIIFFVSSAHAFSDNMAEPYKSAISPITQNWWIHAALLNQSIDDNGFSEKQLNLDSLSDSKGFEIAAAWEFNPAHRVGFLFNFNQPFKTSSSDINFEIDIKSAQLYLQQNFSISNQTRLYCQERLGVAQVEQEINNSKSQKLQEKILLPTLAIGAEHHFSADSHPVAIFIQYSYSRFKLAADENNEKRDFDIELNTISLGMSWYY